MQITTKTVYSSGNVNVKLQETRKDIYAKNGYFSKLSLGVGMGFAVIAGIVCQSGHSQPIAITSAPASGIRTNYNAYTIEIDGVVLSKNGDREDADDMKKTRRVNNGKVISSTVTYSDRPNFPRLDFVENDEIRPIKHLTESEITFTIEYAGKLPKRPRI